MNRKNDLNLPSGPGCRLSFIGLLSVRFRTGVTGWPLVLVLMTLFCFSEFAGAQEREADPLLIDETWTEDFSNGSINGWFSYPLFEDTAFDFTIVPGYHRPLNHLQGFVESGNYHYPVDLAPPEDEDGYYLLRTYRPNSAGQQQIGVAYKKTVWAGESSTLQFDYWLRYPVQARGDLRIDLAGADGRRYQTMIEAPGQAEWKRAELDPMQFEAEDGTPFRPDTGIEAVAVILELDRGAASEHIFVAVDNIRFDGRRQAGFELMSPQAEVSDHWSLQFARAHIRPGEPLSLDVRAEADLEEVQLTLLDPNGEPVASPLDLADQGQRRWTTDGSYRMPPEALGPLTLVLDGRDAQGRLARSDVRMWNLEEPSDRRPRVLLSGSDRDRLRNLIATEERFAGLWESISEGAAEARQDPFPEQVAFSVFDQDYLFGTLGDWFSVMRQNNTGTIFENALVWFIEGDEEARDFAIESALLMAGWDQWIHPWFTGQGRSSYYPLGRAATFLGLTYDLLYEELTDEQRRTIRRGVMENAIIPTWEEYFERNRIPNNTSNWISMAAGGSLVGLMAFYDDLEEDGWSPFAEPWFSGLAEKQLELARRTMMPDGGYGEGVGYQYVTLSNSQDMMAALEHMFGVEGGLLDVLNYDASYLYWLYISTERTHDGLTMGDNSAGRSGLDNYSWIARESDDPVLEWFYAQRPGINWRSFIFDEADAHRSGEPPESHLPDSRIFPDKGNVVFRTGWQDEDAVFAYRSGPNFNHTHFDQGNFRFHVLGEELITESGRASYYSDPYYWSHFIQASGHSTVLVDDFPESQRAGDFDNEVSAFDSYAHITDALVSASGGFVVSELAPVYYADLETLTRRIWFADPGYAIVEDRIVSAADPHTYQVQFYPSDLGALDILDDRQAIVRGEEAEMRIRVLAPDTPSLVARRYPFANRHVTPEAPLHPQGALQVTHSESAMSQDFRVVLAPQKPGAYMPVSISEFTGGSYEGVEFEFEDGRVDRFYFADGEIDDGFQTDARSAFVSFDSDGSVRAVTLEGATRFTMNGRLEVSSEQPAHFAMTAEEDGSERLSFSAPMDAGEIHTNFRTSTVGRVTTTRQDRGESRLGDSSAGQGGTTGSVILSGGSFELEVAGSER